MRSDQATHNLIAVSANSKETAINTEQTLDTTMLCKMEDIFNLDQQNEDNSNQAHGMEEPDTIYEKSPKASGPMNFEMAQAQHFAFLYAFALGQSSPAAAGTGYQHTITPISGDLDSKRSNPSFTLAERLGLMILKRRFASFFVDSLVATFVNGGDTWLKISAALKGTGKYTDNITKEEITADYNVAQLTLAANAVHGADAAARLDNVHQIRALIPSTGAYRDVPFTVVSDATPAVITVTPPTPTPIAGLSKAAACVVSFVGHGMENGDKYTIAGITQAEWSALNAEHTITKIGADSFSIPVSTSGYTDAYEPTTDPGTGVCSSETTFDVIYIPTEPAWCTFPARVVEPPLKVAEISITQGGEWNGTAFVGGRAMEEELKTLEHSFNNNGEIKPVPGAGGDYAGKYQRGGRTQMLKVNREFREFILQQHLTDNDTFGVYILCEGEVYDSPHKYQVEVIFPKVAVWNMPFSVDGKRLAEAGDLKVLEDATYGSVIVKVKNLVATYAA
jgi:hypothetical protein